MRNESEEEEEQEEEEEEREEEEEEEEREKEEGGGRWRCRRAGCSRAWGTNMRGESPSRVNLSCSGTVEDRCCHVCPMPWLVQQRRR